MEIIAFSEILMILISCTILFNRMKILDSVIIFTMVFIISYISINFFNGNPIVYGICLIGIMVFNIVIKKQRYEESLIGCLIGMFIAIISELMGGLIVDVAIWYFFDEIVSEVYIKLIVAYFIWMIILLVIDRNRDKYLLIIRDKFKIKAITMYFFIIILIGLFKFKIIYEQGILYKKENWHIAMLLLIFILLVFKIYKIVIKEITDNEKLTIENNYIDILKEQTIAQRSKEHEYKNHLNTLYGMILVDDNKVLKSKVTEYIKCIRDDSRLDSLIHINNIVVRAIVYNKIYECEEKGINFDFKVVGTLEEKNLTSTDIATILTNLLNNAIEAAVEGPNPYIVLEISKREIRIKNSFNCKNGLKISKITNAGYSTKGANRGFGLYNIRKIVNKIDGDIIVDLQDKEFIISVII